VMVVAVMAASLGYYTAKAGLASLLVGGTQFAAGLAGAFSDNNGYALGAAMILPLLLATAQNLSREGRFERWVRLAFYVSVPLTAFTVVSTFSRGGFLAMVVSAFAFVALQKRRLLALGALGAALLVVLLVVPIQERYIDRLQTIGTFSEVGDESALGRLHFWKVAITMAVRHPLGVGARNYEYTYDAYDTTNGAYGRQRAVHSSHFQVLAEMGLCGAIVWILLFAVSFRIAFRIRRRAWTAGLPADDHRFLFTMANALIVTQTGFLVGGAFLALAFNDLTWLTFALVAALDRLSLEMLRPHEEGVPAALPVPAVLPGAAR